MPAEKMRGVTKVADCEPLKVCCGFDTLACSQREEVLAGECHHHILNTSLANQLLRQLVAQVDILQDEIAGASEPTRRSRIQISLDTTCDGGGVAQHGHTVRIDRIGGSSLIGSPSLQHVLVQGCRHALRESRSAFDSCCPSPYHPTDR